MADSTTLITDKHPSYKAFAKSNPGIKHKTLLAKDHVDKTDDPVHVQKVNNPHAQLKTFLGPFNGVSSKYLQNYLNRYAYVDKIQSSKTTLKQWFLSILLTDQAYSLFKLFKQNAVLIGTSPNFISLCTFLSIRLRRVLWLSYCMLLVKEQK